MAKVTTVFASDDKELSAAITKMNAELVKMREENKKLSEQSKEASKQATLGMASVERGALSAIAAYASVAGGIQIINRELQHRIELEDKIAAFHQGAAIEQRRLRLNIGNVSAAEQDAAERGLERVGKTVGVPTSKLQEGFGSALSGVSGDVTKALEIVEVSGKFAKGLDEELPLLTTALSNIQKITGGDVKRAAALLISTGQSSNIADWKAIANNAPRALIGARQYGFSEAGSSALYSAMTQGTGGTKGEMEATATAALASQLREIYPVDDLYTYTGGKKKLKAKGVGQLTGEDRLERLLADPDKLARFKAEMRGEELALPAMEQLLTPGSEVNKNFYRIRESAQQDMANPNFVQGFVDLVNRGELQKGMAETLSADRVVEDAKKRDTESAYRSRVREKMFDALEQSKQGSIDSYMTAASYAFDTGILNMDPGQRAEGALRRQAKTLSERGGQGAEVKVLMDMLNEIKGMRENQRKSGADTNKESM